MAKKALGRGIDALIGPERTPEESASTVFDLPLDAIQPSAEQPRQTMTDSGLRELADSISTHGVLQPIIVEEEGRGNYRIVAGERRYRAARTAGLTSIPALVRSAGALDKLQIALIENIQREDLTPIEEARAYHRLMEIGNFSQQAVATAVGKKRSTIANSLRLLRLPDDVKKEIETGAISEGHARALLTVVNPADQQVLFKRMLNEQLSVREAESLAAGMNQGKRAARSRPEPSVDTRDADIRSIEQRLIDVLGTKVTLRGTMKRGRIEIAYFSADDLERLVEILLDEKEESAS